MKNIQLLKEAYNFSLFLIREADKSTFGQAAISGYTHYKVVKNFYPKIKRRSGCHVARAVVAKELANRVWHMLTKNEEYKRFSQRDPCGGGGSGPWNFSVARQVVCRIIGVYCPYSEMFHNWNDPSGHSPAFDHPGSGHVICSMAVS